MNKKRQRTQKSKCKSFKKTRNIRTRIQLGGAIPEDDMRKIDALFNAFSRYYYLPGEILISSDDDERWRTTIQSFVRAGITTDKVRLEYLIRLWIIVLRRETDSIDWQRLVNVISDIVDFAEFTNKDESTDKLGIKIRDLFVVRSPIQLQTTPDIRISELPETGFDPIYEIGEINLKTYLCPGGENVGNIVFLLSSPIAGSGQRRALLTTVDILIDNVDKATFNQCFTTAETPGVSGNYEVNKKRQDQLFDMRSIGFPGIYVRLIDILAVILEDRGIVPGCYTLENAGERAVSIHSDREDSPIKCQGQFNGLIYKLVKNNVRIPNKKRSRLDISF